MPTLLLTTDRRESQARMLIGSSREEMRRMRAFSQEERWPSFSLSFLPPPSCLPLSAFRATTSSSSSRHDNTPHFLPPAQLCIGFA